MYATKEQFMEFKRTLSIRVLCQWIDFNHQGITTREQFVAIQKELRDLFGSISETKLLGNAQGFLRFEAFDDVNREF
jgi:hypothetical protein